MYKLILKLVIGLLFLVSFLLFSSCSNRKAKINYMRTDKYGNYYVEWYEPSKGSAYSSSTRSCYFVDSIHTEIFIGSTDDPEYFNFRIVRNYFICLKYTTENSPVNTDIKIRTYMDTVVINTSKMYKLSKLEIEKMNQNLLNPNVNQELNQ